MRKVLSLIGSLAVALALLAAVEFALRSLGLGADDDSSKLKYQQVFLPVMSPDVRADGIPILRTTDPRLPYQQVPAEKAPGTLRIYLFGGSAMAGLGFSPNVTIPRQLERILVACLPETRIEVVNLGIVALPCKKVKLLVEDVLAHGDPDVVVVCSGNNEFLELHARKFSLVNASPLERARRLVAATNLYRLIRPPRPVRPEDLADLAANDARVSEARMIQEVDVSPAELAAVHAAYEADLEEMARAARAAGVPLVLMTVPTNWEWRGRQDLPEDWPDELVPPGGGERDWRAVIAALDARLAQAPPAKRHDWLHRRGLAHRALGERARARDDFRAAMNADPHLRRASDALAERVREVAAREQTLLVDTIPSLAQASPEGLVGFEFFYDYVHFTPRGTALVAAELARALARERLIDRACDRELEALERAHATAAGPRPADGLPDYLSVEDWQGLGLDPARATERDLWKYEAALAELEARLAEHPDDWRALAYRGNAAFFRQDGAAAAERDWTRALELGGDAQTLERNLERLRAQARPANR